MGVPNLLINDWPVSKMLTPIRAVSADRSSRSCGPGFCVLATNVSPKQADSAKTFSELFKIRLSQAKVSLISLMTATGSAPVTPSHTNLNLEVYLNLCGQMPS